MKELIDTIKYYFRRIDSILNKLIPRKKCNVCERKFHHFMAFRNGNGKPSAFVAELDYMTGNIDEFACPYCQSIDRERLIFLFFDKLKLWQAFENANVLHFAPETCLRKRIEALNPREYIKADLFSGEPGIAKIDVMEIPFPDDHFDFVLCCHVLEHVSDENRALAELRRVLKPGGYGVLQTPFSRFLTHTFQDPSINTEPLRWSYYGQEDHVRLFGRDLFDKIKDAGFVLDLKLHADFFSAEETSRYGLCEKEDLILVVKPRDPLIN